MQLATETIRGQRLLVAAFVVLLATASAAVWPDARCHRGADGRPARSAKASPANLVLVQCNQVMYREVAAELVRIDRELSRLAGEMVPMGERRCGTVSSSQLAAARVAIAEVEVRLARLASLRATGCGSN